VTEIWFINWYLEAVYLGPWNSELSRLERLGSSLVLLSVVVVVEVLVDVLFSVKALFLLCRDDPPLPLTVNVDSTTISSNASPNAAVNTRQTYEGVKFPAGAVMGFFSLSRRVQTCSGPNHSPIDCVPRTLSPGLKRPWREANHPLPSSAEIKTPCSYTSFPSPCILMAWCSVTHRGITWRKKTIRKT
jgi:hypothetical protein